MFTGIIAEQGKVLSVERNGDISATVRLHAPGTTDGLALGGSIAVNGVCLTATRDRRQGLQRRRHGRDPGPQHHRRTRRRATPSTWSAASRPAAGWTATSSRATSTASAQLLEREALGNWDRLRFGVPAGLARYIAEKGSIAVDGVSLTVTAVSPAAEPAPWFEVGLIPTTLAETGLGAKATRRPGKPRSRRAGEVHRTPAGLCQRHAPAQQHSRRCRGERTQDEPRNEPRHGPPATTWPAAVPPRRHRPCRPRPDRGRHPRHGRRPARPGGGQRGPRKRRRHHFRRPARHPGADGLDQSGTAPA